MRSQLEKALRLRDLHAGPSLLVLPNAWDAASARVFEDAGFPAIATTSAGIAFAHGFRDGQRIPREEMTGAIARIARTVDVPVTADIEAAYGESPEAVAETVRMVIAAGAVGINLEDSWKRQGVLYLATVEQQQARIRAACEAAAASGIALVVNARTDLFVHSVGDERTRVERAIERLNAYFQAGAACGFPILVRDPQAIAAIVRGVRGPLNIIAGPGFPSLAELQRLGVRRVSFGAAFTRASMGVTRRIARELLAGGDYGVFPADSLTSQEAGALFGQERG